MKKRMFITTIVMMLVLAVALTTSSLAWFSASNASVTAAAATFKAQAASSNINLKISREIGSWGNLINLASGEMTNGSMEALIPTEALKPTVSDGNYVWNPAIKLNGAKVGMCYKANGDEFVGFILDAGNGVDSPSVTRGNSDGYYYDYFYIHNADPQTAINELNFKVQAETSLSEGHSAGESACKAYAALILFKTQTIAVGSNVPDNASNNAGKEVIALDAESVGENEVKATSEAGYLAWVPFAAFSYSPAKSTDKWQYADFNKQTTVGVYDYNNVDIMSLSTQEADCEFATSTSGASFKLDSTSLRGLNSKSETPDTESEFQMKAGETFRVDLYYWLDGLDLDESKDETEAKISISISGPAA